MALVCLPVIKSRSWQKYKQLTNRNTKIYSGYQSNHGRGSKTEQNQQEIVYRYVSVTTVDLTTRRSRLTKQGQFAINN